MATDKTRESIAALIEARAQIETVLAGNADWLLLRGAAAGSSCLAHESAFAADPLYRSWKHLNEAITDLQAKETQARDAQLEERRGAAEPTPAQRPEPRSIELIHILRHIRDSAAQIGDDAASAAHAAPHETPASAAVATDDARRHGAADGTPLEPVTSQAKAVDGARGWQDLERLAPETEEASVSFVIRDAAPAASADGDATQGDLEGGPVTDQWAPAGSDDSLYVPAGGEVEEAEVAIVSRAVGRPRKA